MIEKTGRTTPKGPPFTLLYYEFINNSGFKPKAPATYFFTGFTKSSCNFDVLLFTFSSISPDNFFSFSSEMYNFVVIYSLCVSYKSLSFLIPTYPNAVTVVPIAMNFNASLFILFFLTFSSSFLSFEKD